jgi:hypothetical protein
MAKAMAKAVTKAKAMAMAMPNRDAEPRCRPAPGTPCNDAYFKLIGVLGDWCQTPLS